MKIHKMTRVSLGVALATASLAAFAAPPPNPAGAGAQDIITKEILSSTAPSFNRAEQTGLCLLESVIGMLASSTNDFGCSGTYSLTVATTDNQGIGYADLNGGVDIGGVTLNGQLGPLKDIGTRCNVATADGNNLIGGKRVQYLASHGWSRTNEIFNSDASIQIIDPQTGSANYYREVNINDYFKQVLNGRSWEFAWGLEDIKKRRTEAGWGGDSAGFYYPVQKYHDVAWYQHENGEEGGLYFHKYQVIPRSARGCRVEYTAHDLFNGSGEFETSGQVRVYKASAFPL